MSKCMNRNTLGLAGARAGACRLETKCPAGPDTLSLSTAIACRLSGSEFLFGTCRLGSIQRICFPSSGIHPMVDWSVPDP